MPVQDAIRSDEHGVLRIGDSRVMLDSVVVAYQQGHSAETIQQQYSALSLADVYGAIAYYLRHQADVDCYLQRQDTLWQSARDKWNQRSGTIVQRLRDAGHGTLADHP